MSDVLKIIDCNLIQDGSPGDTIKVFQSPNWFQIKRFFSVVVNQAGAMRGSHAHKECGQALFSIVGKIRVTCVDKKLQRKTFALEPSSGALWIPPLHWAEQYYVSDYCVLGVCCTHEFDEDDYIRDWASFCREVGVSG